MDKPTYVYVTYIRSTAEKVWQALTDGEVTKRYWHGQRNTSDWAVGSPWRHESSDDPSLVDIVGNVVESVRPNRLVVTWNHPKAQLDSERSRVTYDIAQDGDLVRLTVTHDQLVPGSNMAQGIAKGWPVVLSSLKSYLETGQALPRLWGRSASGWKQLLFEEAAR
jgi:uncharacterized protein YndB with AHSA1/START domain